MSSDTSSIKWKQKMYSCFLDYDINASDVSSDVYLWSFNRFSYRRTPKLIDGPHFYSSCYGTSSTSQTSLAASPADLSPPSIKPFYTFPMRPHCARFQIRTSDHPEHSDRNINAVPTCCLLFLKYGAEQTDLLVHRWSR